MRLRNRNWTVIAIAALALVSALALGARWPSLLYMVDGVRASEAAERLPSSDELSARFASVAQVIKPSVVSVSSAQKLAAASVPGNGPGQTPFNNLFEDPFFQRFFTNPHPQGFVRRGLGTGVIVSEDGYILTNNHVVENADEVRVGLPDDRTLPAKVVGTDPKTDLAVLKVDAHGLHPAKLGDSDQLKVGQWVIAAGNPFGLTSTITAGIISATGRSNMGVADYEDFIQTDAAINPGNSGGPLVNLEGEVVGINTAIFSRSGGYMGVGFAIPSNLAHSVMTSLIEHGHVTRGWLGVRIQNLTPGLSESFGYQGTHGALVGQVTADSPAGRGGIEQGDIITGFDGHDVRNVTQLRDLVAGVAPDHEAKVEVFRNGSRRDLSVRLGEQPNQLAENTPAMPSQQEKLGMSLRNFSADDARALGIAAGVRGALVTRVDPLGAAEDAGIRPNDVITNVQGKTVSNVEDFRKAISGLSLSKGIRLGVTTGSVPHYVFIQVNQAS